MIVSGLIDYSDNQGTLKAYHSIVHGNLQNWLAALFLIRLDRAFRDFPNSKWQTFANHLNVGQLIGFRG